MKKTIFAFILLISFVAQSQTLIRILDNTKLTEDTSKYVLRYEFFIPIPGQFYGLPDKVGTLNSFMPLYPGLDRLDGNNVVFSLKDTFDFSDSDTTIKDLLNFKYTNYVYGLNNIIIITPDYMKGATWNGTTWECQN